MLLFLLSIIKSTIWCFLFEISSIIQPSFFGPYFFPFSSPSPSPLQFSIPKVGFYAELVNRFPAAVVFRGPYDIYLNPTPFSMPQCAGVPPNLLDYACVNMAAACRCLHSERKAGFSLLCFVFTRLSSSRTASVINKARLSARLETGLWTLWPTNRISFILTIDFHDLFKLPLNTMDCSFFGLIGGWETTFPIVSSGAWLLIKNSWEKTNNFIDFYRSKNIARFFFISISIRASTFIGISQSSLSNM